jgi:hypothetical protein
MRIALLGGLCLSVVLAPLANAQGTVTVTTGKTTVLTGHLSGAATYGPLLPVGGQAVPDECVSDGCQDHQVRVVVPKGQIGQIAWAIDAPATGPGVDLRIYDGVGKLISSRSGGGADTPTPSTSTYGTTSRLRSGAYLVRTSIIGGVTDYEATLRLTTYRTK